MDPIGIKEIRNYLLQLCKDHGTTILISSHVLSEIEQMANIIGVMHQGKLMEEIQMKDLHKNIRKYVEYEVSDVNKASLLLKEMLQITDFTVHDEHFIRIYRNIEERATINSFFVQNNILVHGIQIKDANLEEYFTKLIGGGDIG